MSRDVGAYERSEDLRVYVRRRADGLCEGCGSPAPFMTARGHPYLEPHHTRRLSDGGPDDYHHVIALCPTCHRRVHHAADGENYNGELRLKLEAIEPQSPGAQPSSWASPIRSPSGPRM